MTVTPALGHVKGVAALDLGQGHGVAVLVGDFQALQLLAGLGLHSERDLLPLPGGAGAGHHTAPLALLHRGFVGGG